MINMYWYIRCYIFVILLPTIISSNNTLSRNKRFLVFPGGGVFKIVFGVSWPVPLGLKQKMSCSVNLQFQLPVPTNITQVQQYPTIISGRNMNKRDNSNEKLSDRMVAYLGVEKILSRYGMDGRQCLLRSICENAMNSLDHVYNGVIGKLLHIFLSPDYGDGKVDEDLDISYAEAQKAGYFGVDCFSLYPNCPQGNAVLDLISIYS